MSKSSAYISLKFDISNNLTKPSVTYDFPSITTYFNSFLPKLGGINYSFVSTKPTISLKRSSLSRDINLYYSSNFTIVKRIHDFYDVKQNDLEMIIEHIPDPKNTDQNNLYMCFGFKYDTGSNSENSDGFKTLFSHISTENIKAATISQATQDNYKISYTDIQFNSALSKLYSKDTVLNPDAVYYLDNSGNTFIVYCRPISINIITVNGSSNPYEDLTTALTRVETSAIFSSTNCQPVQDSITVPIPFEPTKVGFTTLKEGFVSLHKFIEGFGEEQAQLNQSLDNLKRASMPLGLEIEALLKAIDESKTKASTDEAYANLKNRKNIIIDDLNMKSPALAFIINDIFLKIMPIADAKVKVVTEAQAKADAEAQAKAKTDMEAKAKADADAKVKADAEAKAKADADAKAKSNTNTKPTTTPVSSNEKRMYCRPSNNIGGDDTLVTTTINAYANATNKHEGMLLNEVTMIFIVMIVFLFMAFFSPIWFIESNKFLKYNITFLWVCRIAASVLILGGGLLTIVVSRTSNDVPEWLLLVGVIMIICFVLFYMITYSFQKQNLHIQLTDLIENTFEDVDKNNIKFFRNYIFGESI